MVPPAFLYTGLHKSHTIIIRKNALFHYVFLYFWVTSKYYFVMRLPCTHFTALFLSVVYFGWRSYSMNVQTGYFITEKIKYRKRAKHGSQFNFFYFPSLVHFCLDHYCTLYFVFILFLLFPFSCCHHKSMKKK